MAISGKAGHKQLSHAERIFVAGKVSNAGARKSMIRELKLADSAIKKSYSIGLNEFNIAIQRLHSAKTPSQKKNAEKRFDAIKLALDTLDARTKKIYALASKLLK